jgi:hypothetical protein
MHSEDIDGGRPRYSRRQALGRMSAVATAGAVAWVVPEILTAEPFAGASMSGGPGGGDSDDDGDRDGNGKGDGDGDGGGKGHNASGSTNATALETAAILPSTPAGIARDTEIGAAMVAGGWALHRWTSRGPTRALAETGEPDEAESPGDLP